MLPVSRKPGWPTVGHLQKKTTPSSGKAYSRMRQYSIGFAVRNSLIATIETPSGGSLRILALISAYAPTLASTPEAKDQFYEALQETLTGIPSSEDIYLPGDFNARVGTDWQAWPTCLGHFGVGRVNENKQRLLKVCFHHGLCITNSYFKCKELHKASWRHPLSRQWHRLDLVITRRADLSSVLHTRSYHSADYDMDHLLVASNVRLKPGKIHHGKTKGRPRINACGTSDPVKAQNLADSLQEKLAAQPATRMPNGLTSVMPSTTQPRLHSTKKNTRMLTGSCKACWEEMQPVTEAKRKAMLAHKQNPSPSTRAAPQAARSKAQQTARCCAN